MRVAVIGGGVVGLLCAHHLQKRGADVVLLERDGIGGGCSLGNAGWVCPSISVPLPAPGLMLQSLRWMFRVDSPLYIKPTAVPRMAEWLLAFWKHCNRDDYARGVRALAALARPSMAQLDQLARDGIEFESARAGLLLLARSQAVLDAERHTLDELGYGPYTLLGPRRVREKEPALTGEFAGGIDVLPERHVRPESMCSAVAASLGSRGAEVLEDFHATRLEGDGRRVAAIVDEEGRQVDADAFVIATGAEAAALVRQLGASLPLQAGKGYSITVAQPRVRLRAPLHFAESKLALTPFEGAQRVAGTMELSGINSWLDPRRVSALAKKAELEIPGILDGERRDDWVGMRPLTPDGLPVIGRLPTRDNVYAATGHQMLGITLASSTGAALAPLVLGGSSDTDLRPFDPARFFR